MSAPSTGQNAGTPHDPSVEISIDGNPVVAPDREESERELLALIGKSVDTTYLVLKRGKRERESFKDRPDEPIKLHPGMEFVTVNVGPTPVS